jgi:hypothetical protein
MLYWLLPPLASVTPLAGRAERGPLHHVPHRRGQPHRAVPEPRRRPWFIRKVRDFQLGQIIRQEGRSRTGPRPARRRWAVSSSRLAIVPTLLWADLTIHSSGSPCGATVGCGAVGLPTTT